MWFGPSCTNIRQILFQVFLGRNRRHLLWTKKHQTWPLWWNGVAAAWQRSFCWKVHLRFYSKIRCLKGNPWISEQDSPKLHTSQSHVWGREGYSCWTWIIIKWYKHYCPIFKPILCISVGKIRCNQARTAFTGCIKLLWCFSINVMKVCKFNAWLYLKVPGSPRTLYERF